ncbi:uncharacterized protein LOC144711888 isoform X2 [Wolffia australiana]
MAIGKCSCSPITGIMSMLVLMVAVHLYFSPFFPASLGYFSALYARNLCFTISRSSGENSTQHTIESSQWAIGLDAQFPADNLNAVFYRDAPWKAEMGRWLSGCDSVDKFVEIHEVIGNKACKDDCSGQGICNQDLGQCRCFHGFAGESCSKKLQFECNLPASKDWPYGGWMVSMCPAFCDKTRAMCFCGEGTTYPNRPLSEGCGFAIEFGPDGQKITNWTRKDPNFFSTDINEPGWCNIVPEQAYSANAKRKIGCDCKYDGLWGDYCEIPTVSSCINQCSGHGHCRGGFCQCERGWYGIDCSIPSAQSFIGEWPGWLNTVAAIIPQSNPESRKIETIIAIVGKRRPLIYVYDLPPEFNSHLLEGRDLKYHCVNRVYSDLNRTEWTDNLYGSQIALYENILSSPHRTMNAEEADYFYVPVLDACVIARDGHAPHLLIPENMGLRSISTLNLYKGAYDHIVEHYPYWNRSSGRDHLWMFSWDEGACYAPKEIWNSMMLVHWGNTNSKHNYSTTAYWQDNWDRVPLEKRGNHPCFDPSKDLVIPSWKQPNTMELEKKLWARPRKERKILFYFNGNLGPAYENGRLESTYSMGIRQKVAEEFGSTPNKEGKLGRQHAADVIVTPIRSSDYKGDLSRSLFCGVFPGDGWSGRMEDSILQGCIPVVIQDGIFLPYENFLNYKSFAVRIKEEEIPNLITHLRGLNESTIDMMLKNVRSISQRFIYRDSVMLEAERQKKLFGDEWDWAAEFSKLKNDDVHATLIQVLHYKLHNDPWRKNMQTTKQASNLPERA